MTKRPAHTPAPDLGKPEGKGQLRRSPIQRVRDVHGGKVNLAANNIFDATNQFFNPTFIAASPDALTALVRGTLAQRRIWNIPSPVRTFTGRKEDLAALHAALSAPDGDDITAIFPAAALHGMGGVGKSQLALAYAARHKKEYRLGWWIAAETDAGITTGLATLAAELALTGDPAELARRVISSLPDDEPWLLVFDNATGPGALEPYLGGQGPGAIIVTSRNPAWPGITPISVDLLPLADAIDLLLRVSGTKDRDAARRLAMELDGLPLSLEQAAAYANWLSCSLDDYLRMFRDRRVELLGERAQDPYDHRKTVETTFSMAMEQLSERDHLAAIILEMFAFLGPEDLDREFFVAALTTALSEDELLVRRAMANLVSSGLATASGTKVRIHRLVSEVVRGQLDRDQQQQTLGGSIRLVDWVRPDTRDPSAWPTAQMLLPHVLALSAWPTADSPDLEAIESSMAWAGIYLWRIGLDRDLAHTLLSRALAIERQLHEGDHVHVAVALDHLSIVQDARGTQRAGDLGEEALGMFRRLFPGDHPSVALCLNNFAVAMSAAGHNERSRKLNEEALAMRRRLYTVDHPDIAQSLNNLAADLKLDKEAVRARELDEEALAMVRRLFPGDHPEVASSLNSLASDLLASGETGRARELYQEALAMNRRLFPGDHPRIATTLGNLAIGVRAAGETERARQLDEEALAMNRRLHPGDHPDVADSVSELAIDLRTTGETGRARQLDEEALAMRRRLYNYDHPGLAESLTNLAVDLTAAGEIEQARRLDEEALQMFRRLHSGDHPDIAISFTNLAFDLRASGETERARELDEEALAMRERLKQRAVQKS